MDLGLAGAAVCVQGGSKGMGRAAAECFAADGARVAIMARGREALDETVTRLRELGSPDAVGIAVDAADGASIIDGFAEIGARWGELNSLVCAVGPDVSQLPWDQVSDAQFQDAFTIGALSAVRSARAALPLLRAAGWARIVNLAAMSSRSQGFGLIEYTAAKAALVSITKNLSLELAADGILANTVSPGTYVSDQMVRHIETLPADAGVSADDPTSVMRYISEFFGVRADLGRAGIPSDIGPVICFLASARNTYTTGANVNVDGGSNFFA
ncbi:SDR family oxidoreductase [Mycolicibacterium sp.]|uniref:SDR family NAD(P)-dependent oxidoreductase n=1 Tax=Mycolicibacterium sp. TaxID=2320850 RepID=UPI001A1958BF|nr:SDR family oxidoreductase [Mycolicibacterium sp.]MBJ7336498.1 SDR family oxidoreductase [Mycolicibacterium sp.]